MYYYSERIFKNIYVWIYINSEKVAEPSQGLNSNKWERMERRNNNSNYVDIEVIRCYLLHRYNEKLSWHNFTQTKVHKTHEVSMQSPQNFKQPIMCVAVSVEDKTICWWLKQV